MKPDSTKIYTTLFNIKVTLEDGEVITYSGVSEFENLLNFGGSESKIMSLTCITARNKKEIIPEADLISKYVSESNYDSQRIGTGSTILDIGCAETPFLSERYRTIGIDRSPYPLIAARRLEMDVVRADAAHLPFKNGSFNMVINKHNNSIIHNYKIRKDITSTLKETLRVIKEYKEAMMIYDEKTIKEIETIARKIGYEPCNIFYDIVPRRNTYHIGDGYILMRA